jgi:hypothetical protein
MVVDMIYVPAEGHIPVQNSLSNLSVQSPGRPLVMVGDWVFRARDSCV